MAAYCATKAAVESLGDSLRMELAPSGAKVGVAYYAELDTDMTSRGFATKAAARMPIGGHGRLPVAPVVRGDRRDRTRDRAAFATDRLAAVGGCRAAVADARATPRRAAGPRPDRPGARDRAHRGGAAHHAAARPRGVKSLVVALALAFHASDGTRCRRRSRARRRSRRGPRSWSSAPTAATARRSRPARATTPCSSRSAGTGDSGGRFDALGPRTQQDVAEVLRWACSQPWSDGTLGLNGFSASAITVYNSLHLPLPCVKAAVLKSGTHELYRDLIYPGGVSNLSRRRA